MMSVLHTDHADGHVTVPAFKGAMFLSACKAVAYWVVAACKLTMPQVLMHGPLCVQAMEWKQLAHLLRGKPHLQTTASHCLCSWRPLLS